MNQVAARGVMATRAAMVHRRRTIGTGLRQTPVDDARDRNGVRVPAAPHRLRELGDDGTIVQTRAGLTSTRDYRRRQRRLQSHHSESTEKHGLLCTRVSIYVYRVGTLALMGGDRLPIPYKHTVALFHHRSLTA